MAGILSKHNLMVRVAAWVVVLILVFAGKWWYDAMKEGGSGRWRP